MRIARAALVVAVAAVVTGLAGCVPAHTDPGFLVNPTRPNGGTDAQISGILIRDDAGCFALEGEFGTYVVVFPAGTTLAEDEQSIDLPTVGTVELGDMIDWGGGYYGAAHLTQITGLQVSEECASGELALMNPPEFT
jgi:hypothetical protein